MTEGITVCPVQRIRRQQIIREVEGYLDLLAVFADSWPPRPDVRDRLANRALSTIARIEEGGGNRAHILYLKGQAYRTMERWQDAIEPLKEAAEEDPEYIHVWLALAWCYKRTGRLDLAVESLEEALFVDPSQAIIYYNLACYWSLGKNVQLAVEYLSRAFEIDPDYRDLVADESDFDPIRKDPEFQMLTSVIV